MVEVLDRRFLNLSRPRRIFRVAERRVVVSGASVVKGLLTRFKSNLGRLLNKSSLCWPRLLLLSVPEEDWDLNTYCKVQSSNT